MSRARARGLCYRHGKYFIHPCRRDTERTRFLRLSRRIVRSLDRDQKRRAESDFVLLPHPVFNENQSGTRVGCSGRFKNLKSCIFSLREVSTALLHRVTASPPRESWIIASRINRGQQFLLGLVNRHFYQD